MSGSILSKHVGNIGMLVRRVVSFSVLFGSVALAGCANGGGIAGSLVPATPAAAEPAAAPLSSTQINEECWMQVENDKRAPRDLDKRAKLVDRCVDQKAKEQQGR
jgi:hypothetical protein